MYRARQARCARQGIRWITMKGGIMAIRDNCWLPEYCWLGKAALGVDSVGLGGHRGRPASSCFGACLHCSMMRIARDFR